MPWVFDRLILHPETVLEDRPRHFADYAPADFDGRFSGGGDRAGKRCNIR